MSDGHRKSTFHIHDDMDERSTFINADAQLDHIIQIYEARIDTKEVKTVYNGISFFELYHNHKDL